MDEMYIQNDEIELKSKKISMYSNSEDFCFKKIANKFNMMVDYYRTSNMNAIYGLNVALNDKMNAFINIHRGYSYVLDKTKENYYNMAIQMTNKTSDIYTGGNYDG